MTPEHTLNMTDFPAVFHAVMAAMPASLADGWWAAMTQCPGLTASPVEAEDAIEVRSHGDTVMWIGREAFRSGDGPARAWITVDGHRQELVLHRQDRNGSS